MFLDANLFDQPLNAWNVSSVIFMQGMFIGADVFNQPLNNWDTSSVTKINAMFQQALAFNQDISSWDTSSVNDMSYMFYSASSFNQNISTWNVSSVADMIGMFDLTALSTTNYDAILNGWSALTVQAGVDFGAATITYSAAGQTARGVLTSTPNNWTITDGGII
tara:strand:- start:1949 stop:2440 length:492 start_codon:yes stop_codon:yes gene_type:complete